VYWIQETPSYGRLAQYFNATSYGNWWLPISIIIQYSSSRTLSRRIKIWLTSQEPISKYLYHGQNDWILVDIQQAGKYFIINY